MGLLSNIQDKISGKGPGPSGPTDELVKKALSKVQDPDLHRDIVSLGFVTEIKINGGEVAVTVNLTTPACPVKELLKSQCEAEIAKIPGVTKTSVTMTATTRSSRGAGQQDTSAALGQVKNIIAVASGKGGVGKSTTAVNLAFALSQTGAKVGILDADIYGPSVPLMTKLSSGALMKDNMVIPPQVDGIKIISMAMFTEKGKATILRGPMAGSLIRQFLSQVDWGELDYLIIDYPPGTGDIQLTISQTAPLSGAVIVTTPQEVALIDVRKAVSMFETVKVPVLGVIETMSYFVCDGCSKKHYIFRQGGGERLAREFGLPLLGEIPIDPEVSHGGDTGEPIVRKLPQSAAAKAFSSAAGQTAAQISIIQEADKDALAQFSLVWKK